MADNIVLNQGSGGATLIAENTTGTTYAAVTKIHTGALDVDGGPVTATNPLAVQLSQGNAAISASNPVPVQIVPEASGGPSVAKVLSAASTNATSTKASAGQVYGWNLMNNAAYAVFVHFYNKAVAPTVGTDVPVFTIGIPAGGVNATDRPLGLAFSTGIAYAITKANSDTDATAVAAGDLTGMFSYD